MTKDKRWRLIAKDCLKILKGSLWVDVFFRRKQNRELKVPWTKLDEAHARMINENNKQLGGKL